MNFLRYEALFYSWSLLERLLSPFGETFLFVLYRKDLSKPLKPFQARVPITVRKASADEIEQVAHVESDDSELLEQFRDRARRGQWCFVAHVGDERVAYDWACVRPEKIPGGVMAVKNGEVYCTDAYTNPNWRGNNIHPELNYRMLLGVQQAGYHTAYTLISVVNPSSWKALHRVGWERSGSALFFERHNAGAARTWRLSGSLHPCIFVHGPTSIHRQA